MNILNIIAKKRDNNKLSKEEIDYFIKNYTDGLITDYQAAALIMAIYINGMSNDEIANLTLAMAYSGEILDLSTLNKTIVDKHSTGGVGDKVSLILLPLVASTGVHVAKMSGRGLGFTGGTVDKLESIPGYNTSISTEKFIKNVADIGISMISQTLNLAPADKKIYALRDAISCVESIPLIASSIMSKKIASGADKILLDVTVGKGAFMKNIQDAEKLSNEMIQIGRAVNKETICVLTNMEQPLGYAIGNSLEVIEAIEFLKGNYIKDLKEVILELGAYMLKLAGKGKDIMQNKNVLQTNLDNGKAYEKFLQLIKNQNGDISYIENTEKFKKAKYMEPVYSNKAGYIYEINAQEMGKLACYLGAGRITKEDNIDYEAGIVCLKKIGDMVRENEILGYIHSNKKDDLDKVKYQFLDIIKVGDKVQKGEQTILKIIET